MSILINGIEMPHDCDECRLCAFIPVGDYGIHRKCLPLNANAEITIRRADCPLVPVPPHGDLIDRDALLDTATIHWSQTTNESCFPIDEIEYAPTVIPASEEGET